VSYLFVMKPGAVKKIVTVLSACFFFLISSSQIVTDYLQVQGISGKVKQLTEVSGTETRQVYTFNERGLQTGHWLFAPPDVLLYRYGASYNDSGQIVEEVKYDKGFDPVQKTIFAYDSKNTPIGRSFLGHNGELVEKYIYTYAQGRMTDSIRLDRYGNQVEKNSWQYDARGNRIREISLRNSDSSVINTAYDYNPAGKLLRLSRKHSFDNKLDFVLVYKYDDKGNMINEEKRYRSGITDDKKEYSYDSSGNKVGFIRYTAEGKIIERFSYAYHKNGNLAEENKYDSVGMLISRLVYKYDEKNNETERSRYLSSGKPEVQITWDYEYDKQGNWIVKTLLINGTIARVTKREIEYFEK